MQTWMSWIAGAAAASVLGIFPALAAPPPKKKSPNKERQAKPKAREHANFKKAKSCGAASRACLARCQHLKVPPQHARCVNQAKCDGAYSKCMGRIL